MEIVHVFGNTYYYDFGWVSIPYYELSPGRIVLLDLGLREEGEVLCRYFKDNNINPVAVIHSHIHSDHINGYLSLYRDFDFEIYGSLKDLEDELSSFDFNPDNFYDGEMSDLYETSILYRNCMKESSHMKEIEVEGETFTIIKSPGHSIDHRTVITPDGVCYLGDLLMAGKTLRSAKLPFSRKLDIDLTSKQKAGEYSCSHYIAAHDGQINSRDFKKVVKRNLDIYEGLINKLKSIFNNSPESDYEANVSRFEKEIGLHRHAGIFWVRSTIKEIYNYIK